MCKSEGVCGCGGECASVCLSFVLLQIKAYDKKQARNFFEGTHNRWDHATKTHHNTTNYLGQQMLNQLR